MFAYDSHLFLSCIYFITAGIINLYTNINKTEFRYLRINFYLLRNFLFITDFRKKARGEIWPKRSEKKQKKTKK